MRSLKVVQDSAFETKYNIKSLYSPRYRNEQEQGKDFHAAVFVDDSKGLGMCVSMCEPVTKQSNTVVLKSTEQT